MQRSQAQPRIQHVYAAPVLACLAALAACSASAPAPDLIAEKAALLKRDSEWQIAVNEKKDVAKIVSFFTSDAVMIGSGQATVTGHDELTKSVRALVAAPLFKDQWQWTSVELSSDGMLASLIGFTDLTINDAVGQPVTTHARLINVWRKEADGVWRCALDAWIDQP